MRKKIEPSQKTKQSQMRGSTEQQLWREVFGDDEFHSAGELVAHFVVAAVTDEKYLQALRDKVDAAKGDEMDLEERRQVVRRRGKQFEQQLSDEWNDGYHGSMMFVGLMARDLSERYDPKSDDFDPLHEFLSFRTVFLNIDKMGTQETTQLGQYIRSLYTDREDAVNDAQDAQPTKRRQPGPPAIRRPRRAFSESKEPDAVKVPKNEEPSKE